MDMHGKNNPNYRHGKTIENRCIDCNCLIDYRATRCMKCKNKAIPNAFKGKKHSLSTKKLIGKKSSEKFTPVYLKKVRKTYEDRGLWIPENELSEYALYYRQCEWDSGVQGTGDFNLVRDHIYSRYEGFKNNVSPLLMKHPVNCQILKRIENISKRSRSDMTLQELYKKINKYNGDWEHHNECLSLLMELM